MRLTSLALAALLAAPLPAVAQDGTPSPELKGPRVDAAPPAPPGVGGPPPPPPPVADILPPPPPPFDAYVMVGRDQRGPLAVEEVEALVTSGELRAETYAWMPGMAAWQPAGSVPELADIIAATPSAPPPVSYYVAVRGRTTGPYGMKDLGERVAAGAVTPATLVFAAGMTAWEPASTRSDLATLFGPQPAAPALPEPADAEVPAGEAPAVETPAEAPATAEAPAATPVPAPAAELALPPADLTTPAAAEPSDMPDGLASPAAEPPVGARAPDAAAFAVLGGRWSATRTVAIDGVGEVALDLTVERRADGTAKVDGRGRAAADGGGTTVVLRGDLTWLAAAPTADRATVAQRGEIAIMVRRPGKPTERVVVPEDVAAEFIIEADGSMRDTGDGTVWTRR